MYVAGRIDPDDRVREVLARTQTSFTIDGREHTPAQLLERLGFSVEAEQQPELRGVTLVNYRMVKVLG